MKLENIAGKWYYNGLTYLELNFNDRLRYEREMQILSLPENRPAMLYKMYQSENKKGYQSKIGKIKEIRADILYNSSPQIPKREPPLCRIWQASNRNTS